MCKIHYTGWLMDGTRFDSSRDRFGNPFFQLGKGMERACIDMGVATMNRGELAEFVCTAQYAYGADGWKEGSQTVYKVPPRSTIRFEVELFSWSGLTGDQSKMSDADMLDQAYHLKNKGTEYFKMGASPAAHLISAPSLPHIHTSTRMSPGGPYTLEQRRARAALTTRAAVDG